jgi:hypothetical protein
LPNINDIGKINSRIITGVGAVDAVLKGSIENIDGDTVIPITVPSVAYSVRLLDTAVGVPTYTGPCMRVRRASDNVEADVGFDSNDEFGLTSPITNTSDAQSYTDFADFVDHTGTPTDGFVRFWYDQSSNGVDAGQATSGSQPQIYDSATGILEDGSVGNEKPALVFDGGDVLPMGTFASGSLDAMSALSVCRLDTAATSPQRIAFAGRDGTSGARIYIPWITGGNFQIGWNAGNNAVFGSQDQDQHFWTAYGGTVNSYAYKDGTGGTMTNQTSSINGVGYSVGGVGAGLWLGPIQECIIWNSDQHSNRTGIEGNIDTYYQIP